MLRKQKDEQIRRKDFRAALITCAIANAHRDPKKGRAARIDDFMPRYRQPKQRKMPWQQMLGIAKAITAGMAKGGKK